ncbi:hypothetical protein PPYR_15724 [Photinus pyralis]|uniref:Tyr recombinase domain-containing protein n=2 Tax=Photinus pyralis TaxID=7054 RepID=A0A5N3ZY47_PHOPY|nr:hypothetical protein PPYR_15724 [Photinus pyralis]
MANIRSTSEGLDIKIPRRIKTSRKNAFQPSLSLPFYEENTNTCVATASTILLYIEKTSRVRNSDACGNLIITFKYPHKNASAQTISRWIRQTMLDAGIDTEQFSAHSTRHAATSLAKRKGVPLDIIHSAAGWSKNSKTFAKFYKRPLRDPHAFAKAILANKS